MSFLSSQLTDGVEVGGRFGDDHRPRHIVRVEANAAELLRQAHEHRR